MKKKGFTLIEILVTIIIIALIGGIGFFAFSSVFSSNSDKYYKTLESNLLLASNDYFTDHQKELPTEGNVSEVSAIQLVEGKYIETLKKSNGEVCTEGRVYVYEENHVYRYEACIECDENYTSDGEYCSGKKTNEIVVSAKKATSNRSYDVSLNYDSVEYSNENIIVNISMKNAVSTAVEYKVINAKLETEIPCTKIANNIYEAEINTSGTYKVVAKSENKEIATKYINAKIDKGTPQFTLVKGEMEPLTCTGTDTTQKMNVKIVKNNVNEEYQSVTYKIYRKELNTSSGAQYRTLVKTGTEKDLESGNNGKEYYINDSLGSGRYEVEVTIVNFAGEQVSSDTPLEFDISYNANVTYSGSTTTYGKHEVVYGQKYNYKEELPNSSNIQSIKLDSTNAIITGNTKVTNTCTHSITVTLKAGITEDSLSVTYKSVKTNGKTGVTANVKAASGRTGISITYYSDSGCKTKTTTSNALSAGGAPKAKGTYYIKASIAASANYTAASLRCTKAVTVCVLQQTGLKVGGNCSNNSSFAGCKKEGDNASFCCNNASNCQFPGKLYTPICGYKCS